MWHLYRPTFFLVTALSACLSVRSTEGTVAGEEGPARADLVGGQSIVGTVVEKELTVKTLYGTLSVPVAEIIKIRFGLQLPGQSVLRLRELVEILQKGEVDSEQGTKALDDIRVLGIAVVPSLKRIRARVENDEIEKKLDEILEEFQTDEDLYLEEDDQIVAERFTMKGRILRDTFHIESLLGSLSVPRRDLRAITFRETALQKVWKVGPGHLENRSSLVTGVKVKKGQRISVLPAGTMTYSGHSFGPGGISRWTWNGRRMGCLQWRIGGSGTWQLLAAAFEGRAPASGDLQFCVHLTGSGAGGEFTITFKTTAR